jgi:phenylpropionate dioxygenase-like ring-hydroxylating dioxygenase large terminal subunit
MARKPARNRRAAKGARSATKKAVSRNRRRLSTGLSSPAGTTNDLNFERLVDLERGLIGRDLFVDPEIYRRELEMIFGRSWLFVGHEDLVSRPGDYFASSMGEESVILTRDTRGKIHVLLNSCRHRGTRVCRYDQGNTTSLICPYHGWTYSIDGSLTGVPSYREGYHAELNRAEWGLVEVPQLAIYKGTIWANWDATAPPFLDYLGEMKTYLDLVLDSRDGREGGSQVLLGVQKWRIPCNWKLAAENFVGDSLHNYSHRSVDMAGIGPSGKLRRDLTNVERLAISFPELGHGTDTQLQRGYAPSYQNSPEAEQYFKEVWTAREARLGEKAQLRGGASTIFPNTSFSPWQPRTIALWHPRGPTATEAWRIYLVDRDTPEAVKEVLRHYYLRYSGPGGMTEQDDMENWTSATDGARGMVARRYPFNYQLRLSDVPRRGEVPGLITDLPSEQNQRGFYRRWGELMSAARWEQLFPAANRRHGRR